MPGTGLLNVPSYRAALSMLTAFLNEITSFVCSPPASAFPPSAGLSSSVRVEIVSESKSIHHKRNNPYMT